jgi:phosphoribosyl-ATP pyrophosphohydrolase
MALAPVSNRREDEKAASHAKAERGQDMGQGRMQKDERILAELLSAIENRKTGDQASSYTARLYAKGVHKIAQKVGEEAIETTVAAVAESNERLARESADLLYHLLVLWSVKGLAPADVWKELDHRFGTSGPAIKELRRKG